MHIFQRVEKTPYLKDKLQINRKGKVNESAHNLYDFRNNLIFVMAHFHLTEKLPLLSYFVPLYV